MIEGGREELGSSAVAHVHADHIASGGKSAGSDALNVAGTGGSFESVNEDEGELGGADVRRLPVAMAEDAAAVGRIDFHLFGDGVERKWRPRKKVADDGLEVTAAEAAARLEGSEPGGQRQRERVGGGKICVLAGHWAATWWEGADHAPERIAGIGR